MDLQTALIGVVAFIVSAAVLLFISMFGMKEKSYEEALAEQRKQTNALLGTHGRGKSKEKKVKKANKKVKEKQPVTVAVPENETAEESEDTESPGSSTSSSVVHTHQKLHVEFKEPAVLPEVPLEAANNKQQKRASGKRDKVRPILVHKQAENPVITDPIDVLPANHFEQLHPKDEFELLQSHLHIKEDASSLPPPPSKEQHLAKEKPNRPKQNGAPLAEQELKASNKMRQGSTENKPTAKQSNNEAAKDKPNNKDKQVQHNSSPEVHKSKRLAAKQVASPPTVVEKEEPTVDIVAAAVVAPQTNGYVASAGKEKKKKKGDFHVMQQITGAKDGDVNLPLLLNVVRKAELSRSEVQILIDLLLNKQHEAPEVVDEWSEGKADPVQKLKRQLADKERALAEEQEALAGAQAKLREVRAEQTAEKSQLQMRARGLEEALQAKHLEAQAANSRAHAQNQKMQQMQAQLNEDGLAVRKLREENGALQMQRQQMDVHIAQAQEAEATIQDLQARNNQLKMELHSVTEQNLAANEHQQGLVVQLNRFKGELDEKENFTRQFEEIRRDLEHRLGLALRQENELKVEMSQLKTVCQQNAEEIRRLEHGKGQALDEVRTLQKQKEELDHTLDQMALDVRDLQAEKSELQMLKANGVSSQESQVHKEELLNLHNELSSVKLELQSAKSQLQTVEKKYTADLDASRTSAAQLQTELDEQKNKNNELRKKNWKVMEALKAAESRSAAAAPVNVDEAAAKVRSEEQAANRTFVQRLFPDIKVSDELSYDRWLENVEKDVQKRLSRSEKPKEQENPAEIAKLQAQVQHYKTIIEDTEGILKKLQNHIEQEEIHWRNELKSKDVEMEGLRQKYKAELQTRVEQLEAKLVTEQDARQKMAESYQVLKDDWTSSHSDPAVIEKLSEEVNRLGEQLVLEQKNNAELTRCSTELGNIKTHNSSSNGPSTQETESK